MAENARAHLVDGFVSEVHGYIPLIRRDLAAIQADQSDTHNLEEVYRLFHNIKGAASQLSLTFLSGTARLIEDILDQVLEKRWFLDEELVKFIDKTAERIEKIDKSFVENQISEEALLSETVKDFQALSQASAFSSGSLNKDIELLLTGRNIVNPDQGSTESLIDDSLLITDDDLILDDGLIDDGGLI
ncbi:MAG: hypothetical protein D6B25_06995, partial [Desulfobulbaceae bacterium]